MNLNDLHIKYMREALQDARAALDHGEFPVGCVLVCADRVIARGQRGHSSGKGLLELDHAEITALRDLDQRDQGGRDSAYGGRITDVQPVIAYTTMEPCLMCFATLLLNGIRHIVYAYEDVMGGGTNLPLAQLSPLYQTMSVTLVPHVLRGESLALVKTFFSDENNHYWHDSLLARYTLEQP